MVMRQKESVPDVCAQNACAIVVTFNPDSEFTCRIRKIRNQFERIFLIDNGSAQIPAFMLDGSGELSGVSVHANKQNLGVGEALNQGLTYALQEGYVWAVLFDQDTDIYPDMLKVLIGVANERLAGHQLVGSNYHDVHRNRTFHHCRHGNDRCSIRKTVITSGTLLPLQFAKRIGGFRSDYFLDSIDHEFCLRAKANGCNSVITCQVLMTHRIGSPSVSSGYLSRLAAFNHPAQRKYLIARNVLLTVRKYYLREPAWAMRQIMRLGIEFVSIIVFEGDKYRKVGAFLRGLCHGMIGRSGPPIGEGGGR